MAARVPLNSLPEGTILQAGTYQPAGGATAFIYAHNTTNRIPVYVAETGGGQLTQPLTADVNGQLPGYVDAEQTLDIVASFRGITGSAIEANPVGAGDIQGDLTPVAASANYVANPNELVLMTGSHSVTLPNQPASGTKTAVLALTGQVSILKQTTDSIEQYGTSGLTQITLLPGQHITLEYDSGTWFAIDESSRGTFSPTAQSANFAALPGQLVLMSGAHLVTLPSAPPQGSQVAVASLTDTVTINPGGTDTITQFTTTGLTSITLAAGQETTLEYANGVWYAIGGGAGAAWHVYHGVGTPTGITPVANGDWCVRASDGEVFQYVNSVWVDQLFSLQGPQGIQGPAGPQGPAGAGGTGGGGSSLIPVTANANYTATANQLVLMTGSNTVTLPTAPAAGTQVGIFALNGTVTVQRGGTDTIQEYTAAGLTSIALSAGQEVVLMYNAGVWLVGGLPVPQGQVVPPARAYMSTNQTGLAASVWTKVLLNTKLYDAGGNFDATNNQYVCPQAGYYQVDALVTSNSGSVAFTLGIYKNAFLVSEGSYATQNNGTLADVIQCNAGDTISLYAYNGSGAALNIAGINAYYTFMAVAMVAGLGTPQAGQGIATQARAYRNAALTLAGGNAFTKIPVDTISFDPGNNMSVANGRYVAPVTGIYQVNADAVIGPGTANANVYIMTAVRVNGTDRVFGTRIGQTDSNGYAAVSAADLVQLNAGDYVEFGVYSSVAYALYLAGAQGNYLSVVQVAGSNIVGALSPTAQSAAYVAGPGQMVMMTGANQVTLPTSPQAGSQVAVNALTAAVPVARGGTNTISFQGNTGLANATVAQGQVVTFTFLNGVWYGIPSAFNSGPNVLPSRAFRNAALTLTAAAWTKIAVDTATYDPGGNVSTTNGRWVCPVTGYYAIDASLNVAATAAGQTLDVAFYKNGAIISQGPQIEANIAGTLGSGLSDVLLLNAGDYVELYAFSSAALGVSTGVNNWLAVSQVAGSGSPPPGQGQATVARAYRNGAMNLTASVATKVPVDTVAAGNDPGSNFNLTSGRYVCPATGFYDVQAALTSVTGSAASFLQAYIYKNGAIWSGGTSGTANATGETVASICSDIIYCQAGDYLELWGFANYVAAVSAGTSTYLSVVQVGGTNLVGALSPTTQNANFTAGPGQLVLMTGANTVTLPTAPMQGTQVGVAALTGQVTVNPGGTDRITNAGSPNLQTYTVPSGAEVTFSYYNGQWYVRAANTPPNLAPPARAYLNAAGVAVGSGWTKIPIETKVFDPGGNFDVTNHQYVCPTAGYYHVDGELGVSGVSASEAINAAIARNNSAAAGTGFLIGDQIYSVAAGEGIYAGVSGVIQCNAGDTISLYGSASGATGVAIGGADYQTRLNVHQVGTLGAPTPGQGQATAARAYRNAALAIPNNSPTKVPLDTASFDPSGMVSISNGRIVVPATGYYKVDASILLSVSATSTSTQVGIYVYKNGSVATQNDSYSTVASLANENLSDIIQCQAGDYLELYAYVNGQTATLNIASTFNYLSVHQVAGTNLIGALSPTAQTAPYSAGPGQLVLMTGQNAITLPSAPMAGSQVGINALTSAVPVNRGGTDTINFNGQAGQTQATILQNQVVTLTYLNGVWYGAQNVAPSNLTPPARAYVATNNFATTTGWTTIPFDTKSFDAGGNFDIANHWYLAPAAGLYRVEVEVGTNSTASSIVLQVNGANMSWSAAASAGRSYVSDVIQLNAGDKVAAIVSTAAASTAISGAVNTFMTVQQIGVIGAPSPGQGIATQAKASRNAGWTIPAATWSKMPLDTVSYDPGSNIVLGSSRYVCPTTGYYLVDAQLLLPAGANSQTIVSIYKNGVEASRGNSAAAASAQQSFTATDVLSCVAGDYIEAYCYSTNGQAIAGGNAVTDFLTVVQVAGTNLVGALSPTQQSANYTAGPGQLVLMSGNNTVTLPQAPMAGSEVAVSALNGTVNVARQGTDTITNFTATGMSLITLAAGQQITFVYQGGVWFASFSQQSNQSVQPARAYRNATQSIPATTWTKIALDTKDFDPGGNFDVVTNSRYIAPAAGYYNVEGLIAFNIGAGAPWIQAAIFKNGAIATEGVGVNVSGAASSLADANVSDVIQCNAGDYLELYAYATVASNTYAGTRARDFLAVTPAGTVGSPSPGQGAATVARAYRGAAQTMPTGNSKVALDTFTGAAAFDPGNNFDHTNSRYVCPATGYYQVEAQASAGSGVAFYAYIAKSGVTVSQGAYATTLSSSVVSDIIFCQAGDYLELWIANSSGASQPLSSNTAWTWNNYLSVSQVGGSNLIGALSPTAQSANYTAGPGQLVLMTGTNTITLPNAPMAGSNVGAIALTGNVTINAAGTDTITALGASGETGFTLLASRSITFTYLNGVWYAHAQPLPASPNLQNGVVNAGDALISGISINSSTGALTFTLAAAQQLWVQLSSGALVPVSYPGGTYTITPTGLPASGFTVMYGVEVDAAGKVYLVGGTAQSSHGYTATGMEGVTPGVTASRVRVADIGVYNSAGVYQFQNASSTASQGNNWIDRRPWARGALSQIVPSSDPGYATIPTGGQEMAAFRQRVECVSGSLRVKFRAEFNQGSSLGGLTEVWVDGVVYPAASGGGRGPLWGASAVQAYSTYYDIEDEWLLTGITPGSHLISVAVYNGSGTGSLSLIWSTTQRPSLTVMEDLRQPTNNGTA